MDILKRLHNARGFLNSPETHQEDKDFYYQYKEKACQLLQIGEEFIHNNRVLEYRSMEVGREEWGGQSKYLHRGVYCPSPVLDVLITNTKRGKILTKRSKKSRITNRYLYDIYGKLICIDTYTDDKVTSCEYLIYEDNVIYGVTTNLAGDLRIVTEEQYNNGRIQSYIWAMYSGGDGKKVCMQLDSEKYHYDDIGLLDLDWYQLFYSAEKASPSGFIKHYHYRFERENGYLKSFIPVNIDGSPTEDGVTNVIKLQRKA